MKRSWNTNRHIVREGGRRDSRYGRKIFDDYMWVEHDGPEDSVGERLLQGILDAGERKTLLL